MNCAYFRFSDLLKTELISSTEIKNHLCFFTLLIATNMTWIFPGGSDSKESACNAGYLCPIPGEGNGNRSSILAWRTPWTEEPGRLQSMGSQRDGHDWATNFHFLVDMRGETIPTSWFSERGATVAQRLWLGHWQGRSSSPITWGWRRNKQSVLLS